MINASMLRVFCTVLLTVSMQTVFAGDAAVSSTQISRFRYPTTKGCTVDRVDLLSDSRLHAAGRSRTVTIQWQPA